MLQNSTTLHSTTDFDKPFCQLEKLFFKHQANIEAWFHEQWLKIPPPFYTSVDIRNSGFKLAPVDTNLFPAGFNNLHPNYLPICMQAVQPTIAEICSDITRLLLIPESHSRNIHYFESVVRLIEILKGAGFEVCMGSLDNSLIEPQIHELPSGLKLRIEPLERKGNQIGVKDFFPCCIILNNDLSGYIPEIFQDVSQQIIPSPQLGWANRLKSSHFQSYTGVSKAFSTMLKIDHWLINPFFDQCPKVNFLKKEGEECLVNRADSILREIQKKYTQYHIIKKPFLAIKADAGTIWYGSHNDSGS